MGVGYVKIRNFICRKCIEWLAHFLSPLRECGTKLDVGAICKYHFIAHQPQFSSVTVCLLPIPTTIPSVQRRRRSAIHPPTAINRKWISGTRKRCVQPSTYLDDDWVIVECLCAFLPYMMWFNLFNGRAKCGENVKSIWELKGMKWEYKWKVIWSHQMCWDSSDDDAAAADSTHRPFISMPGLPATRHVSVLSFRCVGTLLAPDPWRVVFECFLPRFIVFHFLQCQSVPPHFFYLTPLSHDTNGQSVETNRMPPIIILLLLLSWHFHWHTPANSDTISE